MAVYRYAAQSVDKVHKTVKVDLGVVVYINPELVLNALDRRLHAAPPAAV